MKPVFFRLKSSPILIHTVLLFLLFFTAYSSSPQLHRLLVVEDLFGENLQAAILVANFLYSTHRTFWRPSRGHRIKFGLFSIFSLCLLGEEVSWGTRFFGFDLEWISSRSHQGSADFHNWIELGGNKTLYIIGFFILSILPVLLKQLDYEGAEWGSDQYRR